MAAAVADYRPVDARDGEKIRRREDGLTLELEPVPDLLADLASKTRADQRIIGFALEPAGELLESARAKLQRKALQAIVANPLSTMNAEDIQGILLLADGRRLDPGNTLTKDAFAEWLLDQLPEILTTGARS
jgi:phosphopantothenoylcysteine decarboxylase/phosphopantothenate--cysteine ligase